MSMLDGIRESNARVLVVHGDKDVTVGRECGYDIYLNELGERENLEFIMYNTRAHDYIFNSDASQDQRDELNKAYAEYVNANGGKYTAEIKAEFMEANLDKKLCFELDAALCERILEMFEASQ